MQSLDKTLLQDKLIITESALQQIEVIQNNDYTLVDKVFRIKINAKECDGFGYFIGFTLSDQNDIKLNYNNVTLHIDPFTAYYCQNGTLDYVFEPESNEEGFQFINNNEHLFHGKFFKDEELLPKGL